MFHVISKKKFVIFGEKNPEAENVMQVFYTSLKNLKAENFANLKQTFGTVDLVGRRTIFDVGGNKYRVVTRINYEARIIHVLHVFTHREYDKWNKEQKGK
jgi:mRNA interferase HigB